MTVTSESLDQRLTVGVFDSVVQAATVIDRLIDGGVPRAVIGMLLSDRTAERHFSPPDARRELGAEGTYSQQVNQLARSCRPIAALGTPGAGLVGVGPLPAALVSAGLGSLRGLEPALMQLGVDREDADEVARRVKNGAVLLSSSSEGSTAAQRSTPLIEHEASLAIQLDLGLPGATAVIARPEAPIGEQRGRYEPLIESQDEAQGSTLGANRSGS
jgi:hypothetical protein